jgi:ribosome-binding protein aMBF1 (putative translation factor)
VLSTEDRPAAAGPHQSVKRPDARMPEASASRSKSGSDPVSPAVDAETPASWTFGRHLRRARMAKHWSQHQLAHRMIEVGAKHRGSARLSSLLIMISKWENDRKEPNQYSRHLLAATLEISVEDLGLDVDPDFVF